MIFWKKSAVAAGPIPPRTPMIFGIPIMATLYHLRSLAVKDGTGDPRHSGRQDILVGLTGPIRSDIEVSTEEARMDAELKQYIEPVLSKLAGNHQGASCV